MSHTSKNTILLTGLTEDSCDSKDISESDLSHDIMHCVASEELLLTLTKVGGK